MTYTLKHLQDRRDAASNDKVAEAAFDILIGHVLGEADMYARTNRVLEEIKADQVRQVLVMLA